MNGVSSDEAARTSQAVRRAKTVQAVPTVSVVICAYTQRRWDDLVGAVESVQSQTHPPCELFIVIDHEPTLLGRARLAFPFAKVIANVENQGLSGARNTGVLATNADVIAFLDDDAVADPRWLEHLVAAYADPLVVGVGGTVTPAWDGERPAWFPVEFDWVVGCSYRGQPEKRSVVRNLIGCNMSFRRGVFTEIGGFNHQLGRIGTEPTGCEETELCIRAGQYFPDGKVILEPDAKVVHRVTVERATWRYFRQRCLAEGRSKALLSDLVGSGAGLSSERRYMTRVLTTGVVRGLRSKGSSNGRGQAMAIVCGFVFATVGYLGGRLCLIRDGWND